MRGTTDYSNYDPYWYDMIGCPNEVAISSLQGLVKRHLQDNIYGTTFYWFYGT